MSSSQRIELLSHLFQASTISSIKMISIRLAAFVILLFSSFSHASPCSSISGIVVPGAEVLSITGIQRNNVSVAATPANPTVSGLNICDLTLVLTHPGANDTVTVEIWLPTSGWNGRFQGTGGGGFSAGLGPTGLGPAVAAGYSAGATDGGNFGNGFYINPGALVDGHVNSPLLLDYASRSVHDMAVVGKAVTAKYYGQDAKFSYFTGCSNGGREGYVEAQMYPDDFDGILAASPAINGPPMIVSMQWNYVVMQEERKAPSQCVFQAFINASIALCDGLDGVEDGIISNVQECHFDPYSLVGKQVACDGTTVTIDNTTASIVQKIHDGPTTPDGRRLWYGLNTGTGFNGIYPTVINVVTTNGTTVATPEPLSDQFIKYMLKEDPDYDTSNMSYSQFASLFYQAVFEYTPLFGGNNPDLSAFHNAGGKLLSWHGLADGLVFPNGTINYREQVDEILGSTDTVDEFYALYMAPGIGHCGGGYGPLPTNALEQLVAWVENGTAPNTLAAQYVDTDGDVVNHDLCKYPLVSKFVGGDPKVAGSYVCAESFGPAT